MLESFFEVKFKCLNLSRSFEIYGVFKKELPKNYLEVLVGGIDAEKNTKRKVKHLKIA